MSKSRWTQRDLLRTIDTWPVPANCSVQVDCRPKRADIVLRRNCGCAVPGCFGRCLPVEDVLTLLDLMAVDLEIWYGSRHYGDEMNSQLMLARKRFDCFIADRRRLADGWTNEAIKASAFKKMSPLAWLAGPVVMFPPGILFMPEKKEKEEP